MSRHPPAGSAVEFTSTIWLSHPAKTLVASEYNHLKAASVVPPEDGCLTPETCRGLRQNKVVVKLKVY
jgi:hypothetical protein